MVKIGLSDDSEKPVYALQVLSSITSAAGSTTIYKSLNTYFHPTSKTVANYY